MTEVEVGVGPHDAIHGDLAVPEHAQGVIVFAHGSGSSRYSPRNRRVAAALREHNFATLLFDLLTPAEEHVDMRNRVLRFDIALLAQRLALAVAAIEEDDATNRLPIGLFGASTGAAAALVAAAERPETIAAVVSRGGRPDLAGAALQKVTAPTLLIVGSRDNSVLRLNEDAAANMRCPRQLVVVAGANHLFEEAGALREVARLAGDWFTMHLTMAGRR